MGVGGNGGGVTSAALEAGNNYEKSTPSAFCNDAWAIIYIASEDIIIQTEFSSCAIKNRYKKIQASLQTDGIGINLLTISWLLPPSTLRRERVLKD